MWKGGAVQIGGVLRPRERFWIESRVMLSELVAEDQSHLDIVKAGQSRGRLIGIIQLSEQVTVDKELLEQ